MRNIYTNYTRTCLMRYMTIYYFITLNTLPLTLNGVVGYGERNKSNSLLLIEADEF